MLNVCVKRSSHKKTFAVGVALAGRTLRSNRHVRAMDGHCKLERVCVHYLSKYGALLHMFQVKILNDSIPANYKNSPCISF